MSRKTVDPLELLSTADAALIRSALQNRATRRDVMGWLMAGGVGVATAGSIVTYASQALAETPKKGGRLRVAGSGTSTADTVDPAKQSFSTDYARCNMFYNGLTSLDGALAPQLALAESIENDKATVWTIKLRKDVAFHFLIVKDGTTDFSIAVGTGPYKCQEFKPGVRSIAVRNDGYWKPAQPYV